MSNKRSLLIIGSAGNVGSGIVKACNKTSTKFVGIDPQTNRHIEDITNEELRQLLDNTKAVVYTADNGNRETYAHFPNIGAENSKRFEGFVKHLASINPEIPVWYIGGSWTKRMPDKDWLVHDDSPNKPYNKAIPYEQAKIEAEENAKQLSSVVPIRFVDYASIVPNLAPNFSIVKMVKDALEKKLIKYSPGDFGRPLLNSTEAGIALLRFIENDDLNLRFKKVLFPGAFIRFSEFAQTVKEVVAAKTGYSITFEQYKNTPEHLKTRVESNEFNAIAESPDAESVRKALIENAVLAFNKVTQ